jgi:preprotein translocase subunit SecD
MHFVEESTIGPSLGQENINNGIKSVLLGLGLLVVFMIGYYRICGFASIIGLFCNLLLMMAIMSLVGWTLTMPGIAGIVLTLGIAVDANVLIFARIREEIENGMSIPRAINAGYEKAFVTIVDANVTTLIHVHCHYVFKGHHQSDVRWQQREINFHWHQYSSGCRCCGT